MIGNKLLYYIINTETCLSKANWSISCRKILLTIAIKTTPMIRLKIHAKFSIFMKLKNSIISTLVISEDPKEYLPQNRQCISGHVSGQADKITPYHQLLQRYFVIIVVDYPQLRSHSIWRLSGILFSDTFLHQSNQKSFS